MLASLLTTAADFCDHRLPKFFGVVEVAIVIILLRSQKKLNKWCLEVIFRWDAWNKTMRGPTCGRVSEVREGVVCVMFVLMSRTAAKFVDVCSEFHQNTHGSLEMVPTHFPMVRCHRFPILAVFQERR